MNDSGVRLLSLISENIERSIPKVDFHIHTNWTDGLHSVQEMYEAACQLNLECILFSEHARKSSISWFRSFASEVRALPRKPCLALLGVEARVIDFDGNIGIDNDIISLCDLVIGSVHRFPGKEGVPLSFEEVSQNEALEIEFTLTEKLLNNSYIQILGHPMGMCYSKYGATISNRKIVQLVKKAKENGIAFEVNSKYSPNPWKFVKLCRDIGALISLGSDAHSKEKVGEIINVLRVKGKN
jgi:putative hydrolase